ncbi:MAG: hypothetical protein ACE5JL_16380, partial [Dehalococcoidia bacterium]
GYAGQAAIVLDLARLPPNTRMKLTGAFVRKEVVHLNAWHSPAPAQAPAYPVGGWPAAYAQIC